MKTLSLTTVIAGGILLVGGIGLLYGWTHSQSPSNVSPEPSPLTPTLSDAPALPSPVLQLKQTMTAGHIETRPPSLPLLRGDLQQFSDNNLDADAPSSPKVVELQQRLQRLQTMQRHLDHQE
ncbi:hypothetical protein C1S86_23845 [Vibrio parahaemolyticus]|nr:hypothetical protein BSR61_21720 [Vibrio parahaemolyticus]PMT74096.1 hypothetical protein C1S97_24150 [Vibrio parahaemolyticus]PMT79181.1 hypothetical protein C1S86_23845 [Vibrio parahaemolyticus]